MDERTKLHLALMQVNNVLSLIQGNQYESFMKNKIIPLQVEMNRQLSLLTNAKQQSKIKEQTTN
jgi:hypothetical protein